MHTEKYQEFQANVIKVRPELKKNWKYEYLKTVSKWDNIEWYLACNISSTGYHIINHTRITLSLLSVSPRRPR